MSLADTFIPNNNIRQTIIESNFFVDWCLYYLFIDECFVR